VYKCSSRQCGIRHVELQKDKATGATTQGTTPLVSRTIRGEKGGRKEGKKKGTLKIRKRKKNPRENISSGSREGGEGGSDLWGWGVGGGFFVGGGGCFGEERDEG